MSIPLFGIGLQGKNPKATSQYRKNLYYEYSRDADRTQVSIHGTPGLVLKLNLGDTRIRGIHELGDYYYVIHRGTLYQVTNAHIATSKGTLNTTTGFVDIRDNGTEILIVDGTNGYIYNTTYDTFFAIAQVSTGTTTATTSNKLTDSGGAFTSDGTKAGMVAYNTTDSTKAVVTAVDSDTALSLSDNIFSSGEDYGIGPSGFVTPTSCEYFDSYFMVTESGTDNYQINSTLNGADWDALDFSSADKKPDNLKRVFEHQSEAILFGDESIEFHVNTGFVDFPFRRLTSNEWGLVAKGSVADMDNSVIFLGRNATLGEAVLVQMADHTPVRVSGSDWEKIINGYADITTATAFSYMVDGHPMYQINFTEGSWLYDASTGVISEVKSTDNDRHLADNHIYYNNQHLVGDYAEGKVYLLDKDTYDDNGELIQRVLRGKHIFTDNDNRVKVSMLELIMETGVGLSTGQGSDPQAILKVSRDGGRTYGNELWRSFGKIGEYLEVVRWRNLGVARDFVFEFTITDPVKVSIVGANVKAETASS